MKKAIITVVGKDAVGIIAAICTYLSEQRINILDISQTIVNGWFNMMMVADLSESAQDFSALSDALRAVGEEKGVIVHCQSEEIFQQMHRI